MEPLFFDLGSLVGIDNLKMFGYRRFGHCDNSGLLYSNLAQRRQLVEGVFSGLAASCTKYLTEGRRMSNNARKAHSKTPGSGNKAAQRPV